jgi:hypothetical protein
MGVATALAVGAGVAGLTKGISAGIKKNKAKKDLKAAEDKANDAKVAMEELEANRQEVINPAEDMQNEFENLGVATQASKFQAEEADIALANTLDTIQATGGGAGGASALAKMALQSKRGISADIQKQEKSNEEARAQGAAAVESAKIQGEQFKWNAQEQRDVNKLDRMQADKDNAEAQAQQADLAKTQANMDMVGAVGETAGTFAGGIGGTIGG